MSLVGPDGGELCPDSEIEPFGVVHPVNLATLTLHPDRTMQANVPDGVDAKAGRQVAPPARLDRAVGAQTLSGARSSPQRVNRLQFVSTEVAADAEATVRMRPGIDSAGLVQREALSVMASGTSSEGDGARERPDGGRRAAG